MALIDDVTTKVKDASGKLTPTDLANGVAEAINRYNRVREIRNVQDYTGNGTNDFALPTNWVPEFSGIIQIEYPQGQIPMLFLDPRDYQLYLSPTEGTVLRILTVIPSSTETLRVWYSSPHLDETTIAAQDLNAVANMASAVCLRILAAAYGQTSDPTIQADTVNYRTKADEFRRLADAFEAQYNEHMGIGKDAPVSAATCIANQPDNGPVGLVYLNSRVRMTHGRRP